MTDARAANSNEERARQFDHKGFNAGKMPLSLRRFALLLFALPFIEIAGFVLIGSRIGVLATLVWTIASAMLGIGLVRRESLMVLLRADEVSRQRRSAAPELVEGALIALAGLLLIIPGFVTDAVGLALFIRPLRRAAARRLAGRVRADVKVATGSRHARAPDVVELDERDWREIGARPEGGGDPNSPWRGG